MSENTPETVEPAPAEAATDVDVADVDMSDVPADETLVAAVGLARSALEQVTPAATIGEPAGHVVEGEHVVSLLFDSRLDGYTGWRWSATLARPDAESEPTILETELVPGDGSLLAPEWVPWAERLAKIQAAQDDGASAAEEPSEENDALDEDDEDIDDEDIDEDDDIDGVDIDDLAPELEVEESDEAETEADDGAPEGPGDAGAEDGALDDEERDPGDEPAG